MLLTFIIILIFLSYWTASMRPKKPPYFKLLFFHIKKNYIYIKINIHNFIFSTCKEYIQLFFFKNKKVSFKVAFLDAWTQIYNILIIIIFFNIIFFNCFNTVITPFIVVITSISTFLFKNINRFKFNINFLFIKV